MRTLKVTEVKVVTNLHLRTSGPTLFSLFRVEHDSTYAYVWYCGVLLSFNVRTNSLGILLQWRFWFNSSRWSLKFHISNKLPSDVEPCGPWAMLCLARWFAFKKMKQFLTNRTHSSLIVAELQSLNLKKWVTMEEKNHVWIVNLSMPRYLRQPKDELFIMLNGLHRNQGGRIQWAHKLTFTYITEKDVSKWALQRVPCSGSIWNRMSA